MKNYVKHVKMIIGDIMVKKKNQKIMAITTLLFFVTVLFLGIIIILKPDILKQHNNIGNLHLQFLYFDNHFYLILLQHNYNLDSKLLLH